MVRLNSHDRRVPVLVWCGAVSSLAFLVFGWLIPDGRPEAHHATVQAANTMKLAIGTVSAAYEARGLRFDDAVDPNHTGLIGEEYTELTTTLGNLEAKRTTTNPAMAGLMVRLLTEAGVRQGDTIALGCSGSFPAMAIAALSAAEAMKVVPVMIISLGASSYGATRKEMTLLDILSAVKAEGLIRHFPVAATVGGANDVGNEFEPETREFLLGKIAQSGVPLLREPDLQKNVASRLGIYFGPTNSRRISAFVNIGGSFADMGSSPLILKVKPGVTRAIEIPSAKETHGVVFAMANRHIPVVHVLNIRSLAAEYGIPWDPIPLPTGGTDGAARVPINPASPAGLTIIAYFSMLLFILIRNRHHFIRIPS